MVGFGVINLAFERLVALYKFYVKIFTTVVTESYLHIIRSSFPSIIQHTIPCHFGER